MANAWIGRSRDPRPLDLCHPPFQLPFQRLSVLWIGLLFSLIPLPAFSYIHAVTQTGIPLVLKKPYKVRFVGNPVGKTGLTEENYTNGVIKSLQRWKAASHGLINFDYWQGSDPKVYIPNGDFNGFSSIYFASNSSSETHLSSLVLGLTQVWYKSESGEILEADIVLNDKDFYFTNDPTDTSGFGGKPTRMTDGKTNVYIQNVVTHELGHSFGLSHSGGLQSTMLFMESPEQAHLGCDEQIAVRATYPVPDETLTSSIQGEVLDEKGKPVFGAHVLAISERRGTVIATGITDKAGRYRFASLEPGNYFLVAEPFYAGAQSLPPYYSDINSKICSGALFSRSVLLESDGLHLLKIAAGNLEKVLAPPIQASCKLPSPVEVPPLHIQDQGLGIFDQMNTENRRTYALPQIQGSLEIHALAYSLYSPLHLSLNLKKQDGTPIPSEGIDPIYIGESGFINYDSSLIVKDLPLGNYALEVTALRLGATEFPAGPISLDAVPYFILTGTTGTLMPNDTPKSDIPANARCRMKEDFERYQIPPGLPSRSSTSPTDQDTGACARIQDSRDRGVDSKSFAEIVSWMFPGILILISRIRRIADS